MKTFTYLALTLTLSGCAWWNNCDKCFVREKKSKSQSTAFSSDDFIETKRMPLFAQSNRQLIIQFKKIGSKKYVLISQLTNTNSLKREFVLGSQIKMGFIFDNKQNYILTFPSSENQNKQTSYAITSNQTEIESSLNELLKKNKIISLEIQNPFLTSNESNVKQWDIATGDAINKIYNCFLSR